jgi:hypothetical protein
VNNNKINILNNILDNKGYKIASEFYSKNNILKWFMANYVVN